MMGGGGGNRNDFKFGTFVGRFWSDGAASMAVKGLKEHHSAGHRHSLYLSVEIIQPLWT